MSLESQAIEFIAKEEGFEPKAKWDVNHYRLGHGSDTITLVDGTHRKVLKGDVTTKENARKDLERRVTKEFLPTVKRQIGQPYFDKLTDNAKVGLISLAYNYGSITKKPIITVARTGDLNLLAKTFVDTTYNDNSNLRERRSREANLIKLNVPKKETPQPKKEIVKENKDILYPIVFTALITLGIYATYKSFKYKIK